MPVVVVFGLLVFLTTSCRRSVEPCATRRSWAERCCSKPHTRRRWAERYCSKPHLPPRQVAQMVTTRSRIRTAQVGIITPRWLHCQNLNDLTHVLVHSDQEECSTTKAEKRKTGEKYNTVHLHYAGTNAECACKTQTVHLHYEGGGEINSPHVHWITEEEIQGKH